MFSILDGRAQFYQWDIDRKLVVEDSTITEVHFCNKTDECSLVCETYTEDGKTVVNVPNILLQDNWRINVYAYNGAYTKFSAIFNVVRRSKPADYIYTETELKDYDDLEARVDGLEDNIGQAVADYLEEHPIEGGATKLSQLENDTGYINEETAASVAQQLDEAFYCDLDAEFAKKSELEGYVTHEYLAENTDYNVLQLEERIYIAEQQIWNIGSYAISEEYMSSYLKENEYQTKSDVEALISDATGDVESALDAIIAIQNGLIGGNA